MVAYKTAALGLVIMSYVAVAMAAGVFSDATKRAAVTFCVKEAATQKVDRKWSAAFEGCMKDRGIVLTFAHAAPASGGMEPMKNSDQSDQ